MKVSINFNGIEVRQPAETEVNRLASKLGKLLQSFSPDLVQLHGSFEKHPRKEDYGFSLNLSLPTGTMHATGTGADLRRCARGAFGDLQVQLKKHLSKLRRDYTWKRKRPRVEAVA